MSEVQFGGQPGENLKLVVEIRRHTDFQIILEKGNILVPQCCVVTRFGAKVFKCNAEILM